MKKEEININDRVEVKLTKVGIDVLNEHYTSRKSVALIKYHHKGENIYKFQLWELMRIFGKYMEMGATQYFEDNTIIMKGKI